MYIIHLNVHSPEYHSVQSLHSSFTRIIHQKNVIHEIEFHAEDIKSLNN